MEDMDGLHHSDSDSAEYETDEELTEEELTGEVLTEEELTEEELIEEELTGEVLTEEELTEEELSEEELSQEDIDNMLEEGLPKTSGAFKKRDQVKFKQKFSLEEIGQDHFELLPPGWIKIVHSSGIPVYLHRSSRVCTMTRPYYLGDGSTRHHKIPLSAVPCLQYKRTLEKKKNEQEKETSSKPGKSKNEIDLMAATIETSEDNEATQLNALDLRQYCQKLFQIKKSNSVIFKTWEHRKKYRKMVNDMNKRPTLPAGTKLLKIPIRNNDGSIRSEWTINLNNKSHLNILHEYVQHIFKKHPKFKINEIENPSSPFSAVAYIDEMQYGKGLGKSKRHAKNEAAKATLEILIPEIKYKFEQGKQVGTVPESTLSVFDQIKIEDPRVAEYCKKTSEPPPYNILLSCLAKNLGLGNIQVSYEVGSNPNIERVYTMRLQRHEVRVMCKNKRNGKQQAAQAMLKVLHPNLTYWGSILKMYGNVSIETRKEKKKQQQEITKLQGKCKPNEPNYAILNKLRSEMMKLREKRMAMGNSSLRKFTAPAGIGLSSSDLGKVNLDC